MSPNQSHFPNAHDFRIDALSNVNATNYYHYTGGAGTSPLDRLLENISHGSLHNSADRGPNAPKCHPETRVAIQQDIMGWIYRSGHDDYPKQIMWLSGPAGSGKTAIAGTIADQCHDDGVLAASFFFSAFSTSPDRRTKGPFVATLAYQLLQHRSLRGFKEEVLRSIDRDPMIFQKRLSEQLKTLILTPLRRIARRTRSRKRWPKVIIIDGLDECGADEPIGMPLHDARRSREEIHREILCVLFQAAEDPSFPFRILIASRPEPAIRGFIASEPAISWELFLDEKYDPDSDIALYLRAKFGEIRRRFSLPRHWASKGTVRRLVRSASGQFIYAATVIRFIENGTNPPQEQLESVLMWRQFDHSQPFAALDALYKGIIQTSPDPSLATMWIHVIHKRYERNPQTLQFSKVILESFPGETEYLLGMLTSLVGLQDENGNPTFRFYHQSLLDFLSDPKRSGYLHIDNDKEDHFVRGRYSELLQYGGPQGSLEGLQFNANQFMTEICRCLQDNIDLSRKYSDDDVSYWLSQLEPWPKNHQIGLMFERVHAKVCVMSA